MTEIEILEVVINRMEKIIELLAEQSEHHWCCGCGHWNGANLPFCATCGRRPNEDVGGR